MQGLKLFLSKAMDLIDDNNQRFVVRDVRETVVVKYFS